MDKADSFSTQGVSTARPTGVNQAIPSTSVAPVIIIVRSKGPLYNWNKLKNHLNVDGKPWGGLEVEDKVIGNVYSLLFELKVKVHKKWDLPINL